MREIRTEIEIDATPAAVWETLTDLPSYPEWNPHIVSARGEIREGAQVRVTVRRAGERDRMLPVTVTAVDPPRRLEWVGSAISSRIFEGRHTFELEPLDADARTRLVNHERLSGVLVPFVVSDEPHRDYEAMNRALAERVERDG